MSTRPEGGPSTIEHLVGFADFATALGGRLDLSTEGWAPTDTLTARLGWDSLSVLEVLAWVDEMGVDLPDELVGELRTLGDLHHYVVTIGSRAERAGRRSRRPLVGARVRLVPLTPQLQGEVMALYTEGDHFTRYRLRGVTPSPEGFHHALWDRTLIQFVAVTGRRVEALVSAYEADLRNRHAHIAVVARSDAALGVGVEATALLVDHLFQEFDLRKLYAEVLAPNMATFASGVGRLFEVEGRLTAHEYINGRYEDMVVMAITRDRWARHVDHLLGPRG